MIEFIYDDGGRKAAGFKGTTGDCVCRAIAIATCLSYQEVYDSLNDMARSERITKRSRRRSSARSGVRKPTIRKFMDQLGWKYTPTMGIGTGCKVHLRKDELPSGRLVVQLSGHLTAVVDGVLHDLSDCSRDGTRCVYGYWRNEAWEASR